MLKIGFSLLLVFSVFAAYSQTKKDEKRNYAGKVEYVLGNFGSFSYPVVGDSITASFDGVRKINLKIFPATTIGEARFLEISLDKMNLVKKEMYTVIETPTKSTPSGNYDLKFATGGSTETISIVHKGDGTWAYLTLIVEYKGFTSDILTAKIDLKK